MGAGNSFRTHVRTLYIDILCFVRYCTKLGIRIHREGLRERLKRD